MAMNPFIRQMVNDKINNMTPTQLRQFAAQYDMDITTGQARIITSIMHEEIIDIANSKQRKRILEKITTHVNENIAKKAQALLDILS